MKRMGRWGALVLLGTGILVGAAFFGGRVRGETKSLEMDYLSHDETDLLSFHFETEKSDPEGILQELLGRLNNKEKVGDGVGLLPAGVQITTYSLGGSLLEVEFSEGYASMSLPREFLARAGIVRTLLQVPGVTGLRFRIGEKELLDSGGNPVGNMTSDDFLDFSSANAGAYQYDSFTLYYADREGKKLYPEVKNVFRRTDVPRELVILEQLAKGPLSKGNYPTISENTIINSVQLSGRTARVDLSRAFLDYPTGVDSQVVLASIANSVIAAGNVDKVQISVAGNEHAVMAGGVDLYRYISWNEELLGEE